MADVDINWDKEFSYPTKSVSAAVSTEDIAAAVSEYMTANPVDVPTKVSELENDSKYQTESDVQTTVDAKKITTSDDGDGAVTIGLA